MTEAMKGLHDQTCKMAGATGAAVERTRIAWKALEAVLWPPVVDPDWLSRAVSTAFAVRAIFGDAKSFVWERDVVWINYEGAQVGLQCPRGSTPMECRSALAAAYEDRLGSEPG